MKKNMIAISVFVFGFTFFSDVAWAVDAYEIGTYGSGDFLAEVWKGIAILTSADKLNPIFKIVFIFSVLVMAAGSLFSPGSLLTQFFKYFLFVLFLFVATVNSRSNILINDYSRPANTTVVSDVPYLLAVTASTFSTVGVWLTDNFEEAFGLPDSITFKNAGLAYSLDPFIGLANKPIYDASLSRAITNYLSYCHIGDVSSGDVNASTHHKDCNLLENSMVPKRKYLDYYAVDASGAEVFMSCEAGYADVVSRINGNIPLLYDRLAVLNKKNSGADFRDFTEDAHDYLFGASASSSKIMKQLSMEYYFDRAKYFSARRAGIDPRSLSVGLAQGELQQKNSWLGLGLLSKKWIPRIRGAIEGMLYGLFPVVLIISLVSPKVLIGWITMTFWIYTWGPTFVIINLLILTSSSEKFTALISTSGGCLNRSNIDTIQSWSGDMYAISGLLASVALSITFSIVSGSAYAMVQTASSLMPSQGGSVAGGVATTGNISMGNTSLDNFGANKFDSVKSTKTGQEQIRVNNKINENRNEDTATNKFTHMGGSEQNAYVELPLQVTSSKEAVKSATMAERKNLDKLNEKMEGVSDKITDTISDSSQNAIGRVEDWGKRTGNDTSNTVSQMKQLRDTYSTIDSFNNLTSEDKQKLKSDVTEDAVRSSFGANASVGGKIPFIGGVGANASAQKDYAKKLSQSQTESLNEKVESSRSIGSGQSFENILSATTQASDSEGFTHGDTNSESTTATSSKTKGQESGYLKSLTNKISQSQSNINSLEKMASSRFSSSANITGAFFQDFRKENNLSNKEAGEKLNDYISNNPKKLDSAIQSFAEKNHLDPNQIQLSKENSRIIDKSPQTPPPVTEPQTQAPKQESTPQTVQEGFDKFNQTQQVQLSQADMQQPDNSTKQEVQQTLNDRPAPTPPPENIIKKIEPPAQVDTSSKKDQIENKKEEFDKSFLERKRNQPGEHLLGWPEETAKKHLK